MEIERFPPADRPGALALAGRLHAADRRQREPYANHLLRVTIRILSHYRVTDPDVEEDPEQPGGEQTESDLVHGPAAQPGTDRLYGGAVREHDEGDTGDGADHGHQHELRSVEAMERARSAQGTQTGHGRPT
jgi:hypothetical protein